jgi:hypothetical protein
MNTAVGFDALGGITTGTSNIALGNNAGLNLNGSNYSNIEIGNQGTSGDNNVIRIGVDSPGGTVATYLAGIDNTTDMDFTNPMPVYVDTATGQLGYSNVSSQRYKKDIRDMGSASDALLAMRPVTFHYKSDPRQAPQYGLIAEEVDKVDPDLVVRTKDNSILGVRYEAVNMMLLNEFQKEHQEVESQKKVIAAQAAHADDQQRQIDDLKTRLDAIEKAIAPR